MAQERFLTLLVVVAVMGASHQAEGLESYDMSATEPLSYDLGASLGETVGNAQEAGQEAKQEGVELVNGLVAPGSRKGGSLVVKSAPVRDPASERVLQANLGQKALNSFQKVQDTLLSRARALRDVYDHPPEPAKGVEYHRIPGLVVRRDGRKLEDINRINCETKCTSYSNCRSYSYSLKTAECIWSTEKFKYGDDTTFYLRTKTPAGDLGMDYTMIPGLSTTSKNPAQSTPGSTVEECKFACSSSAACTGYGFSKKTEICIESDANYLEFDGRWDYYEKDVAETDEKESPPNLEIQEASQKKISFEHAVDVKKVVNKEQNAKAFTEREYLRTKTIAAESKVKKLEADRIQASNEYEVVKIKDETLTRTVDMGKKRLVELAQEGRDGKEKLEHANTALAAAGSKEKREKYRIDIEFMNNKIAAGKKETVVLNKQVKRALPKETQIKHKLKVGQEVFDQATEQYREGMFAVSYDEARVAEAAKEKDTKLRRDEYEAAKDQAYMVSQSKPLNEKNLDAAQSLVLKTKIAFEAQQHVQKRYKQDVERLRKKNQVKFDRQKKLVDEFSKKRAIKLENEKTEKATALRVAKEHSAKISRAKEKDSKGANEKAEKHKLAMEEKEANRKTEMQEEAGMKRELSTKKVARLKAEKERHEKEVGNSAIREQEDKQKEKAAKQEKKDLEASFNQMRNFEKAVQIANEQEEKAKQKNEIETKALEKSKQLKKEKDEKYKVKFSSAPEVIEAKRKKAVEDSKREIAMSLLLVKEHRVKKQESECNTICRIAGEEKTMLPVPLFQGCFKDDNQTRAMPEMHVLFEDNSKENCNMKCLDGPGATMYFALQGTRCNCAGPGSGFKRYGKAEDSQCIIPCPGVPRQACGGPLVNRVYEILIPRGTFKWTGHIRNDSIPINPQNKAFVRDGCQCLGARTPKNAPSDSLAHLLT